MTIENPRTSRLAISSLILAILSPFGSIITGVPAFVLGIYGLIKIVKSNGKLKGKWLAIAGFGLPLVFFSLHLYHDSAHVRIMSNRVYCAHNLSGLGKAMLIYSSDWNDSYPTGSQWSDLLVEHADVSPQQFLCKSSHGGPCSYAMNGNIEQLGLSSPGEMVLLFETYPGWNQVGGPEILNTERHENQGCNVLFNDLSIRWGKTGDLEKLLWNVKEEGE